MVRWHHQLYGKESEVAQSCPTLCDPMDCSLLGSSVWNFPGKSTGVSCRFLLQGVFPTGDRLNLGLPHCRQTVCHQSQHGSPSTQCTWVKASSGRWWRTGKSSVLQCMGFKELDTTEQMNSNNKGIKLDYLFEIFLMHSFVAVSFPLTNAFVVSYKFYYFVVPFSFFSRYLRLPILVYLWQLVVQDCIV